MTTESAGMGVSAAARAGGWTAVPVVAAYMASSVIMVVANKNAVARLRAGTLLLGAQLLFTVAAVPVLTLLRLVRLEGTRAGVLLWAPTGLISGCAMWAGMQAVRYSSLTTLTVVRNASPLFLLIAEWFTMGVVPTQGKVLSLLVILAGVFLYAWDDMKDSRASSLGVLYIVIDAFLVCLSGLVERYLLSKKQLELSTAGCVMVSNAVGLLPVALLLAGPKSEEIHAMRFDTTGSIWALITLPGGVAMAFLGVYLRCVISATSALVVANVDKVAVLLFGLLFMGDAFDGVKAIGCGLALGGGVWHALEPQLTTSACPALTELELDLVEN